MKRILLLYFMRNSGHHSAARAVEEALLAADSGARTLCVDPLEYAHPRLARLVFSTFVTIIKRTPDVWGSIYDNRRVEGFARRINDLVQPDTNEAFLNLLRRFEPHAVVCTQAYPFMLLCRMKQRGALATPLFGVLTDLQAHCFWANGCHATYIASTDEAAAQLERLGVPRDHVRTYGIPVRAAFAAAAARPAAGTATPRVLVMGGSRGLGPGYRTIKWLDRAAVSFAIDVVAGANALLEHRLASRHERFAHPLRVRGVARNVAELMRRADLLVSKAGGLTSAEALCRGLPLIIVNPLPGQEERNADVLVRQGAAVRVHRDRDIAGVVTTLLCNAGLRTAMRDRALALARPDAARRIAEEVLGGRH